MRPQTALFVSALGEEFRSAREARGLSLSDVAERLHIRSVYLAAIEDEDWHVIGAPVYVRGFMRTYARFLGLDPEAAVTRFAAVVPAAGSPAAPPIRPSAASNSADKRAEQASPSLAAILSIVVAAVVVLFVGYEFYQYRTASSPVAVPTAGNSSIPSAAAKSSDAVTSAAEAAAASLAAGPPASALSAAAAESPKHGLSLSVTETSWLRVTVDGTLVLEGTLPAGSTKSFTGKVADLRVGNAGGVRIAVNGHALRPLGATGDVVERHLVLSGE
jgi:cytoskeleton protein RodZ